MTELKFPPLNNWAATHQTLHLYTKGMAEVMRAHTAPHPKWEHISLHVESGSLHSKPVAYPGGTFTLRVDLLRHAVVLSTNDGAEQEFSMTAGLTSNQFAENIFAAVAELDLPGPYPQERFEDDGPREYDPSAASAYLIGLQSANQIFQAHHANLASDGHKVSAVNFWPHGFDIAFELFGDKMISYERGGEELSSPAQLNLGFSPGEPSHPAPYFYSNPWPFDETLVDQALPAGARWFTDSWQGSIFPYAELAGDPNAGDRLLEFAQTVHKLVSPGLME